MKPIKLSFSGLNSYRTRQEINFEALGADGLFGIFGPTGSGKSSILDAITLALYGEVDRAYKNRGIIHQLEKTLDVSFQFELGGDCYLVERHYERNIKDLDSAIAKQARLRCLKPDSQEVLASKPQEVTVKIEEILGINCKEFSRAVVLPQGKFDQFLRLTGGDRAAMLEHLFNLEQYGEELVAKVKNEVALLATQLQRIEGEEQGLGDCSAEAVNQAVADLTTKNDEFAAAQKNFEAADQSYQEAEAVRELFLKRKTALEKRNQLGQEQAAIDEKQIRLNAADQAEPLRELIARQKELYKKIDEESIVYQSKINFHSEAVTKHDEANRELEKADKEYTEQLPLLQERKAKYQDAQEKQKKLKDIQKNIDEKQWELEALKGKIFSTTKEIAVCKKMIDDTRAALDMLQQEKTKFMVDPGEKETVDRALTVLARLEDNEKRYQESNNNYVDRKLQNDGKWAVIVDKVQQMMPDKTVSAGDNLEEYTSSLVDKAEKDLEKARKAQQAALIVHSAAELVKELHDGEPCPVCGSREHPLPAKVTGDGEKIEIEVMTAEKRLREVRSWETELLKLWHDWSISQSLVNEARKLAEKCEKDIQESLAEFEKVRGKYERDQLRYRKQELSDFEKRLHLTEQRREELQKTQQELAEKLQNLNDLLQSDKITEASLGEALKGFQSQLKDIEVELNQITGGKDLDGLIQDMVQTYNRLQKTLEDAKGIEKDTRNGMEKLAREIASAEATLTAYRNEVVDIDQRLGTALKKANFTGLEEAESVLLETMERQLIRQELEQYRQEVAVSTNELDKLDREINNRSFEEPLYEETKAQRETLFQELEKLKTETALAKNKVEDLREKQERWNDLQRQKKAAEKRKSLAEDLANLLRGRKFVSFLAQEHLRDMTHEASCQLGRLTGQRYALELTKDKDCEFIIRDDYNGGNRRVINSLSGGEIFMTSLALALALSSKIQLRGKYPLGFFFLDEGFGSLDEEKLDKVMNALEKLHDRNRIVGVISHVKELKERLPRYLEVAAAGEDGSGSRIRG
jgi:ATPase involved in DNA repair